MRLHSPARLSRWILWLTGVASTLASLHGQTVPLLPTLDNYVVTATRTPQPAAHVGTVTDVLTADELSQRQITLLSGIFGFATGTPVTPSGAAGEVTSVFMRGANSNQTLFLVDGIRLNDPNTDYQVYLGGATLGATDRVEIALGPQSTLYGGEAVGGVVSITAQRGQGAPTARIGVEGGSFGTVQGALAAQGAAGDWGYSVSADTGHTENARPNNDFTHRDAVVRLDRTLTAKLNLGGTLRWFHGETGEPGDRYTNDPNNENRENNLLATVFAEFTPAEHWFSRLTIGDQERRFESESPAPNPPYFDPSATTKVKNHRTVADWTVTYSGLDYHRITAGINAEWTRTQNDGFGQIDERQSLFAIFAQDELTVLPNLFLTGGLRNDDFDTFGHATTGRATVAWLPAGPEVKLRASYGTSFRSPSFLDLYGKDTYYVGNPNLRPEKAHGWDAGVDWYWPEKRGVLSVTWFETDFTDLIVYDFSVFPSTEVNADRARTRGLELSAQTTLGGELEARIAYTYLEADNLASNTRLLRRPRHAFNADAWRNLGHGVMVGAGVAFAANRQDVDAQTFATIDAEDYTVVRLYAAWQATGRLTLKVRFENLLNEKYAVVNGYPALGFGAFGGADWKF
ncbi:MAG: TonB-dependent receptor [Opitutaceae bacterium]